MSRSCPSSPASGRAFRKVTAALATYAALLATGALLAGCIEHQTREVAAPPGLPDAHRTVVAPPAPRAGVVYAIRNVADGEVITGPKAVGDAFVGVDDDRGRTSQRWTLLPLRGGRTFQLRVTDVGLCLADHGRGVMEEACDEGNQDQHWLLIPHAGHHEIMFRDNAHCLGITSRGKLVDNECHGDPGELWDFVATSR